MYEFFLMDLMHVEKSAACDSKATHSCMPRRGRKQRQGNKTWEPRLRTENGEDGEKKEFTRFQ